MPSLRNMAITIEQRGEACFHWVVLQAADDSAGQDVPLYHRIESSARPLRSHAEAVAAGRAVVRRLAEAEEALDRIAAGMRPQRIA